MHGLIVIMADAKSIAVQLFADVIKAIQVMTVLHQQVNNVKTKRKLRKTTCQQIDLLSCSCISLVVVH